MSRTWTNSPDREFTSREQASAFYACLIWCREWSRRLKSGQAMTTIEDVCREAVERSKHAKLAELSEEAAGELDHVGLREVADSEMDQQRPAEPSWLSRNMAAGLRAKNGRPSRGEGQSGQSYLRMERDIDRIISDLERGEGQC